jgi:hypothetical protein
VLRRRESNCKRLGCVQQNSSSVWHTGLSGLFGALGWSAVKLAALGNRRRRTAKNHRTVQWCTRLSGEPTVASANGRPCNLRTTRGLLQQSAGAPDCPVCTRECLVRQSAQRSKGRICQIWKEIAHRTVYKTCPVVHQTVRCATRQKARIAFHVNLQRLLAALGL